MHAVVTFTARSPTLDFLLLLWSQDVGHLRFGRHANVSRLSVLLLRGEGTVVFQAFQLPLFVLKDRPDFLFLIVGEIKFLAKSLELMLGLVATQVLGTGCSRRWLTRVLGECAETGKQQGYQKQSKLRHGSFSFNDCVSDD